MEVANTTNPPHLIKTAESAIAQPNFEEEGVNESTSFLDRTQPTIPDTTPGIMASGENPKLKKEKPATESISTFNQHMTTAAHACILLFVILIIYFCFSTEFEFFTWHPLLLSIGWVFLMSEAILTISKDNLFTGTLPKKVRVKLHWIFLTTALVLILIGIAIIYVEKDYEHKQHFTTWHGTFGIIGTICAIPTCLDGIAALYHGDIRVRNYISPRINKLIHITCGVITFTCGGIALILSVYTKWFARHSGNNILTFVLGLVLVSFPVIWTLYKPAVTCLKQLKNLIKIE